MEWASTASDPKYGILPFILTSVYGTCGAILLGVPVGLPDGGVPVENGRRRSSAAVMESAVSLLAGIPSVVYGLVGMLVLVPGIRKMFHVPDGASLLAAMIVLAIMILPSDHQGLRQRRSTPVPKEYEDASLALGATPVETWFRVSAPAAQQRHRRGRRARRRPRHRRGHGRHDGQSGNAPNMPSLFESVRFLTTAVASEMSYAVRPAAAGAVFHRAGSVPVHHAHQRRAQLLPEAQKGVTDMLTRHGFPRPRRVYIGRYARALLLPCRRC